MRCSIPASSTSHWASRNRMTRFVFKVCSTRTRSVTSVPSTKMPVIEPAYVRNRLEHEIHVSIRHRGIRSWLHRVISRRWYEDGLPLLNTESSSSKIALCHRVGQRLGNRADP